MRKRVFIGSSSEELGTAKIVKEILDKDFDVVIWNESVWDKSVFKLNQNFLTDLLSATLKFDYGILIGSPDDKVEVRGKEYLQARDNVLFELGLFIGRLGIDKCAFLVSDDVKIPTDFGGIKLSMYNKTNLFDKIKEIQELFLKSTHIDLNFFPSSVLASTYFENFIKYVNEYYINNGGFTYEGKKYGDCVFKIMIPETLSDNLNLQFQKEQNRIGVEKISFGSTNRPRNIGVDISITDENKLILIDFPTTLSGINHAISYLLPKEYREHSQDYKIILERELNKFIESLEIIFQRNNCNDFIVIERF
ncbi:STING domain-containing protein [Tenacibaculum maritimum]|uniref:CBASS system CD-NTase-associated NAD(+) hydrolase Cap12 n=2 Tax=Tenacibaculum maritimum TaxID=107401 RepID=UPI0012E4CD79|nr:STING domain-containing protein [Tenacibaculum maritimum]CAA0159127.1 conserved hypothetical protein [Tenacibaculum maritimum]